MSLPPDAKPNFATLPSAASLADPLASPLPDRLTGLPPVVSEHTVVLILGSFPGAASLRAGQYYAHPQNQFWKILQALWPQHALPPAAPQAYPERCAWLLARGLGLWDVYDSCEREGSLDTSIRHAQVNDFARLHGHCPQLAAVAHNGGESFKHAGAVLRSLYPPPPPPPPPPQQPLPSMAHDAADVVAPKRAGILFKPEPNASVAPPVVATRLPSTSPANASWSFDRKLAAWGALMAQHGLV